MFGSKNRLSSDEIKALKAQVQQDIEFYHKMDNEKSQLEANVAEIRDSRQQVEQEIAQLNDNISGATAYIQENINVEASMIYELENASRQLAVSNEDFVNLKSLINKQYNETAELVDANKHFTTPSKMLQELPAELHEQNAKYTEQLNYMAEYSKQMSVLSLNAAIEAGRMGENGMQFVNSAEAIRNYVANYNVSIEAMRKQMAESEEKIAKMEEQIKHLISLLKDNNVATGKLFKHIGDVENASKKVGFDDYANTLDNARNNLIGIKNIDEELLKTEERNRMQISDMEAEFEAQLKNEDEFLATIHPIFQKASEIAKENAVEVEQL